MAGTDTLCSPHNEPPAAMKTDTVSLIKKADRERLEPRTNPYYMTLDNDGLAIGYYKTIAGGAWRARLRHKGEYLYLAMKGVDQDDYRSAEAQTRAWAKDVRAGVGQGKEKTVRQVCDAYIEDRRREVSDTVADKALAMFENHVYPKPIAKINVADLTMADVKKWRAELKGVALKFKGDIELSAASKDRFLKILKAALNYGYRELKTVDIQQTEQWSQVVSLEEKPAARDYYSAKPERTAIIANSTEVIQPFFRCLDLLPLRPGALANAKVKDLNLQHAGKETLFIAKDKVYAGRYIPLSKEAVKLLKEQAKDKLPEAPLFMTATGKMWNESLWRNKINASKSRAGADARFVCYTFRHSVITDMIIGGIDVLTVAKIAGTSLQKINDVYGHLIHSHAREKMDAMHA